MQRCALFLCKNTNPYISPNLFNNALQMRAELLLGCAVTCNGTEKNGIVLLITDKLTCVNYTKYPYFSITIFFIITLPILRNEKQCGKLGANARQISHTKHLFADFIVYNFAVIILCKFFKQQRQ